MARYIDADKLIAHLEDEIKECEIPFGSRANGKGVAYGTILGLKSAISFATALSTENVVPKRDTYYVEDGKPPVLIETSENRRSEVAREIFEEIEKVIGDKYNHYVFGNNDLDSIEQDAIVNFSDDLSDCFEEIKKKYVEEKEND